MPAKYVELHNGHKMPLLGLGTGSIQPAEADLAIATAIEAGYRHFDCAFLYGNEKNVGEAIKKCIQRGIVSREELFITSKLPMTGNHPDRVEMFLQKSLDNLQLSYLDMYLIHFPVGFKYEENSENFFPMENGMVLFDDFTDIISLWKAMENQVSAGRAKSIGLSNFNSNQIARILKECKIQPANLQVRKTTLLNANLDMFWQVEAHLYFQQKPLHSVCQINKIVMSAFAPLGSLGRKPAFVTSKGLPTDILTESTVKEIAEKYNKTPAQILLHFLVSQNIPVIPKSSNSSRIQENSQLFDFDLSSTEIENLKSLDKGEGGRSFCFSELFKGIENHPENPENLAA